MKADPVEQAVKKALKDLDTQQCSPQFIRNWRMAELKVERINTVKTWRYVPAYALSVVTIAVFAYIFFMSTKTELPEPILLSEFHAPSEQLEIINPGNYWHAPSDALLRVDTLAYQDKFITFANYDPITMEIRE